MTTKKKTFTPRKSRQKADQVEGVLTACLKCESTERTEYKSTRTMKLKAPLRDPNGVLYNVVRWKRTTCKNCGQNRVDRFLAMEFDK